MQDHVEEEPPHFKSLVRPIYEDGIYGHRTSSVHLAGGHRIVREEPQLQQIKRIIHLILLNIKTF